MAGLATTFGSGAMTNSIAEIEAAGAILVAGSNTTNSHPQVARRIYDAVDRGAKLIVIDPRQTRLARHAHVHLRIRPGTDILLLNGIMRCILDENLIDDLFIEMRTENFIGMRDMLLKVDLAQVAAVTGVDLPDIRRAARYYASARHAVICYCMGVTQHVCGTSSVHSYANLAMLTGQVEQEFTGVDPLRGQNNVQGACDMGALPGVYSGYQAVSDPYIRAKFEAAWGVKLPSAPGLTLLDMTHGLAGQKEGAEAGKQVRGMYIMGENPMLSDPGLERVGTNLRGLDFLVVADIFLTETAELADVVLPAVSFAEKEGTVTNSERRVQLMQRAIKPIGKAMSDDRIIMELARRLGYSMDYESTAEIMEEIALLTPVYGGIYHDRLKKMHGLQWPCPNREHGGTKYLHKYSFSRGRGRFEPAEHVPPIEPVDEEYPLAMITGRGGNPHYHTGTMTRRSPSLNRELNKPLLAIHPEDAKTLGLRNGDGVRVSSRRGSACFYAGITSSVRQGEVFANFHFREAPVNVLTVVETDPKARIPEFKICAVRAEKVTL